MITSVPIEDAALVAELAALRLLPGEPVDVVEVIPFGGPLLVQTAGGVYALGRRLAGRITVATGT
jgi:Fe2+ transport system protein FeoA